MPRQPTSLNATTPTASLSINQDVDAEYLVFYNNNPVPVYIRIGSPEIPSQLNYDHLCPPNMNTALPVSGRQFGLRLGDLGGNVSLFTGNTVVEALWNEPPPAFGGIPINAASLSISEVSNGLQAYTAGYLNSNGYDMLLWGGAIIAILPDATSGQGVVQIEVSSDRVTWRLFRTQAIWPGIPLTINHPRISRYFRVSLLATLIAGEPIITGFASVRLSLTEIPQADFSPGDGVVSKAINVSALGTTTSYFVTVGLSAIEFSWVKTAGTSTRGEAIWYTGPTATGPWSLVAFREQSLSSLYNTVFRSLGSLDNFLRVDCLDISNGTITSTLSLKIQQEPELASYLQNQYSALGDVGQPVNTNQSIYHVLSTIRLSNANIDAYTQSYLPLIYTVENTNLPGIKTDTANLPGIYSAVSTNLPTLSTISSTLSTISNRPNTQAGLASVMITVGAAGTIYWSPIMFNVGTVITALAWTAQVNTHPNALCQILIGLGNGGAVSRWLCQQVILNPNLGAAPFIGSGGGGTIPYSSERAGGIIIAANEQYTAAYLSVAPGTIAATWTMA